MRWLAGALCASLVFGLATAGAAGGPDSDLDRERAALQQALARAWDRSPHDRAVAAALKDVIADPAFASLSNRERHSAYLAYGAVLSELENYADAKAPIDQATAMSAAGQFDWELRANNSYALDDQVDSARAMTLLVWKWPDSIKHFQDDAINRLGNRLAGLANAQDLALALLDALHGLGWHPADPFKHAGGLWLSLARLHLQRGELDLAKAAAADIYDATDLVIMHADKIYDPVVEAAPDRFDVARAAQAELDRARQNSAAAPTKLEGVNAVARILLNLNRPQEALDLIDAARDKLKVKPDSFDDRDDILSWTLDLRSRALFALGRSDEVLPALAAGAATEENGAPNVSQAINLADEYYIFDRPKDALAAVAALDFSQASPYGRMALEDARACPYYQLGDRENLAKVLDYMKMHIGDGGRAYLNTMLCTGNLDAVAAEMIAELADPARRDLLLYFLQDYPVQDLSRREAQLHADWIAVIARPDVKAAIDKVGHIASYPFASPSY